MDHEAANEVHIAAQSIQLGDDHRPLDLPGGLIGQGRNGLGLEAQRAGDVRGLSKMAYYQRLSDRLHTFVDTGWTAESVSNEGVLGIPEMGNGGTFALDVTVLLCTREADRDEDFV